MEIDEHGFLLDSDKWTSEIAEELAKTQSIELTEKHWKVVNYIREYFISNRKLPMIKNLSKAISLKSNEIDELFPEGPDSICIVAGLQNSKGCF